MESPASGVVFGARGRGFFGPLRGGSVQGLAHQGEQGRTGRIVVLKR